MTNPKDIKLIGFNLTKYHAEKNPKFQGKIEISSDIKITNIEKHKIEATKQDTLKIDFELDVNYKELGKISLSGTFYLLIEPKTIKEIEKQWKSKKLPEEFNLMLLNIIVKRTSVKTLQLGEEIGLPPHINFPKFQKAPTP